MQREEQEAIEKRNQGKDMFEVLNTQIKGKVFYEMLLKSVMYCYIQFQELMKAEMQRVAEEDRIEIEKLKEQVRREEIEGINDLLKCNNLLFNYFLRY